MKARGLIKRVRASKEKLRILIKTFKPFLRLPKRPTIRSLPSKPSIKKTKNFLKLTFKNCNLVLATKRKVT